MIILFTLAALAAPDFPDPAAYCPDNPLVPGTPAYVAWQARDRGPPDQGFTSRSVELQAGVGPAAVVALLDALQELRARTLLANFVVTHATLLPVAAPVANGPAQVHPREHFERLYKDMVAECPGQARMLIKRTACVGLECPPVDVNLLCSVEWDGALPDRPAIPACRPAAR